MLEISMHFFSGFFLYFFPFYFSYGSNSGLKVNTNKNNKYSINYKQELFVPFWEPMEL